MVRMQLAEATGRLQKMGNKKWQVDGVKLDAQQRFERCDSDTDLDNGTSTHWDHWGYDEASLSSEACAASAAVELDHWCHSTLGP